MQQQQQKKTVDRKFMAFTLSPLFQEYILFLSR